MLAVLCFSWCARYHPPPTHKHGHVQADQLILAPPSTPSLLLDPTFCHHPPPTGSAPTHRCPPRCFNRDLENFDDHEKTYQSAPSPSASSHGGSSSPICMYRSHEGRPSPYYPPICCPYRQNISNMFSINTQTNINEVFGMMCLNNKILIGL